MTLSAKICETNPLRRLVCFATLITTDDFNEFALAYRKLTTMRRGKGLWDYVNRPLSEKEMLKAPS